MGTGEIFRCKGPITRTAVIHRSGKSGEWRDKLSRRQVREIVAAHHKQMARFGYLTDELKHLVPEA